MNCIHPGPRGECAKKSIVRAVVLAAGGALLYLFWEFYLVRMSVLAAWFLVSAGGVFLRVLRTWGGFPGSSASHLRPAPYRSSSAPWGFVERLIWIPVFVPGIVVPLAGPFLIDGYDMQ